MAAEHEIALATVWGQLGGTLLLPEGPGPFTAALLVAGSGPTDRDGNNALLPAAVDNLKLMARELARRGLASLRYDKRGIGASLVPGLREEALRFDDMVDDAAAWVRLLQVDSRIAEVVLVGHSEGALVAALAAEQAAVRAVVSVAGAGERASSLMRQQILQVLPSDLAGAALALLAALDGGQLVEDVPQELALLFRPSVQPYLVSWFRHDPAQVLARLQVPVLLVHGAGDTQVRPEQARKLAAGRDGVELRLIEGMDHLLAIGGQVAPGAEQVADALAAWLQRLPERVPA